MIKKVLPRFAEDGDFIAAFINEARVSTCLSHGNIARRRAGPGIRAAGARADSAGLLEHGDWAQATDILETCAVGGAACPEAIWLIRQMAAQWDPIKGAEEYGR